MQCTAAVLLRRRAHIKTAAIEECLDRIKRCVNGNLADAAIQHLETLLAPGCAPDADVVCSRACRAQRSPAAEPLAPQQAVDRKSPRLNYSPNAHLECHLMDVKKIQ